VKCRDCEDAGLVLFPPKNGDTTADSSNDQFRDARVRYVRNAQNVGSAANFTQSFGLVSGSYFKRMAADDMLAAGYLRACVQILEEDPSVVLVTTKPTLVDEDGRTPLTYDASRGVFSGSYAGRPIETAAPYMADRPSDRFRGVLLSMPGKAINNFGQGLMRSEFVRRQLPLGSYLGWDKVFLAGLSLHGKLAMVNESLFIWRHHKEQFSMMNRDDARKAIDPAEDGRAWRTSQVKAYARAVMASPISMGEKARCLVALSEKVVQGSMQQVPWRGALDRL